MADEDTGLEKGLAGAVEIVEISGGAVITCTYESCV
jgi:hypothetical protein